MRVDGTAAVVTGGCSGLGAATAAALAARGAHVVALDLPDGVERAERAGPVERVAPVAADVTDPEQVRRALGLVASGGLPLRTVVNCAGIGPSRRILGRSGVHDPGLFAEVVRVNLVGTFTVLALVAEVVAATDAGPDGQRGVVVNTASIAAFDGQIGQTAYAASKGGVVSMTLPAARDLARFGIRVCCIAPGVVDTPMLAAVSDEVRAGLAANIPFPQRLCSADEYARLVLAVVDNDYLNGETIRLDGALRMPPR